MNYKSCFILMPFSKAKVHDRELSKSDLDFIYQHIIQKASNEFQIKGKKYFKEVRRFSDNVGSLINGIVGSLNDADVVIADLTGLNPNVMYELGVRHSLKRGTIIITQDINSLPSDLRGYMTIEYEYSDSTKEHPVKYEDFKRKLFLAINELIASRKHDSPVLDYFQGKERFKNEEDISNIKRNIVIIELLYDSFLEISNLIVMYNAITETQSGTVLTEIKFLRLVNYHLNALLNGIKDLAPIYDKYDLYTRYIKAEALIEEIVKGGSISEYLNMIGNIAPETSVFSQTFGGLLNKSFHNPFTEFPSEIKFVDIFKDDSPFVEMFLEVYSQYLEDRKNRLVINDQEIENMLM